MSDIEQLNQYSQTHRGQDLEPLVRRHLDWVHSCAVRQLRGDVHLAADVTQAVFLSLAQKPPRLRDDAALAGWLFGVTRYLSFRAIRSESRRRRHEEQAAMQRNLIDHAALDEMSDDAWKELAPMLDTLVARLGEKDRRSVVLRFFQQRIYAELGLAMGISEEAARKRVLRAVEKLRQMMSARGVTAPSAAVLSAGMLAHATQTAPLTLAGTVSSVATGGAAATSGLTIGKGALLLMSISNLKWTIAAIVLALLIPAAAVVVMQVQLFQGPTASPTGTAAFSFVDTAGKPVAGADVYIVQRILRREDENVWTISHAGPIRTDASGKVHFTGLEQAENIYGYQHILYATVPGKRMAWEYLIFGPQQKVVSGPLTMFDVTPFPGRVIVPPGTDLKGVRVRPGSVSNGEGNARRVYLDSQGDDYRKIWPTFMQVPVAPDGSFTIDMPDNGALRLLAEGPGLGQGQGAWVRPIDKSVEIVVEPEGIIAGTLTYADSHQPAKNVALLARYEMLDAHKMRSRFFARTDDNGRYRFTGLSAGVYAIQLASRGGEWIMPVAGVPDMKAGQTKDLPLELQRGVPVTGRVVERVSEKPIKGIFVNATSPAEALGEHMASTRTDADGQFTLRLPVGVNKLTVEMSDTGYYIPFFRKSRVINLGADGKIDGDLTVRLLPHRAAPPSGLTSMEGTLSDASGKPLAGIVIGSRHFGTDPPILSPDTAITDENGKFDITLEANIPHELFIIGAPYVLRGRPFDRPQNIVSVNQFIADPEQRAADK